MQKLKIIQQRVFCIFFRTYQRISGTDTRGKISDKLIEVDIDMLGWYDPTDCPRCPGDAVVCPTPPKQFRPIGPSDLVQDGGSDLPAITDPANTRQLKYNKRALQFYDFETEDLNENGILKPNVSTTSRTLQPFNDNRLFTEDLWFLHSTWTSFEKTKLVARPLIDSFGMDSIMVCAYVPMDLEILPNK